MRFIRKVCPVNGSNCVYLDLEGLQLQTDGAMTDNTVIEQYCYFRISTFDILKVKTIGMDSFDDVFRPVHTFFGECNDDELRILAMMYLNMHYDILDKLRDRESIQTNISDLTCILSKRLQVVDDLISVVPRLSKIVERDIPIPSFNNVGERPQDTEEMTFRRDEVVDLATIVVLCKMLTPIFGVYIERCKKKMDTSLKEIHCVGILMHCIGTRFSNIVLKLKNFITKLIAPYMKNDLTFVYHGHTLLLVSHQIYAAILTRRFVNINLYQPNCNLMTYITACARSATASAGSTAASHKNAKIEEIKRPNEIHGDDGNTSILEMESRCSAKTADQLGIIELSVKITIDGWLSENDKTWDEFNRIHSHYLHNPLAVTPINTYLICVVFGNQIGGAASVEMMTFDSLTKMVTLLQMYLMLHGFYDLVHLVSVNKSLHIKMMQTSIDNMLRATAGNTYEYRNVDSRFPWSIVELRWDSELKVIVDYLTTYIHIQNTAPEICEQMGITDINNGTVYQYRDTVTKNICALVEMVTTPIA